MPSSVRERRHFLPTPVRAGPRPSLIRPMTSLTGKTVLVIGRGSGIARAIADAARAHGAAVIAGGRHPDALAKAYRDAPDVRIEAVDLTDDASITALAERVGTVDHVVSTASARARGRLDDLTRDAVQRSFDTKVIG